MFKIKKSYHLSTEVAIKRMTIQAREDILTKRYIYLNFVPQHHKYK